eukprot:8770496-Prorocentrum_lima.AAC.1
MIQRCGQRLTDVITRQMNRVTPEDGPRYQYFDTLLNTVNRNIAFAQASDRVGTLGGAHTHWSLSPVWTPNL